MLGCLFGMYQKSERSPQVLIKSYHMIMIVLPSYVYNIRGSTIVYDQPCCSLFMTLVILQMYHIAKLYSVNIAECCVLY